MGSASKERVVMEMEVTWDGVRHNTERSAPMPERTILLNNLPLSVKEDDIVAALEPCGGVSFVEIRGELNTHEVQDEVHLLHKKGKAQRLARTRIYAIVEMKDEKAYRKVLQPSARVFGVLFTEPVFATEKARKPSLLGRPAYPQPACFKRSLLVLGIPRCQPWHVMHRIAQCLALGRDRDPLTQPQPCTLRATNPSAFCASNSGPPEIVVEVDGQGHGSVNQHPWQEELRAGLQWDSSVRRGSVVLLRFRSFAEAYLAQQRLHGLELGLWRRAVVGFSPKRPEVVQKDSFGNVLPE